MIKVSEGRARGFMYASEDCDVGFQLCLMSVLSMRVGLERYTVFSCVD